MTEGKQKQDKKGVVLLIVIGTVLIVIFLANVFLNIITSHSRLTHHQVSRIQAYYASMAGVNLAMEELRTGAWSPPPAPAVSRLYCINCPLCPCFARVTDANIPYDVRINIFRQGLDPPPPGPGGGSPIAGTSPIQVFVDYTYTP